MVKMGLVTALMLSGASSAHALQPVPIPTPVQKPLEQFCETVFKGDPNAIDRCVKREPALSEASTSFDAWAAQNVQPLGWTFLGSNEETAFFTKAGPSSSAPSKMIWSRWERRVSERAVPHRLSGVTLYEISCSERRARSRQSVSYSNNNLTADNDQYNNPGNWEYAVPGSVLESLIEKACGTLSAR